MCDWEWDDMAMAGLLGQMIADEMIEEAAAYKENEPLTPNQILDEGNDKEEGKQGETEKMCFQYMFEGEASR